MNSGKPSVAFEGPPSPTPPCPGGGQPASGVCWLTTRSLLL